MGRHLPFVKMQATGNDFVLIEAQGLEQDWAELAQLICNRPFGVGSDGVLLVLRSEVADFRLRMFNPDGSEAEACGNGMRCLTRYVIEGGLAEVGKQGLTVETMSGIRRVKPCIIDGQIKQVQVGMGVPKFNPEEIPLSLDQVKVDIIPILDYQLSVDEKELPLTFLSMGNPHAVCFIKELVVDFPLAEIGPKMERHNLFPQRVNFEVANVVSQGQTKARVWERGVGETLSCGSGACAIVVAARLHCYVGDRVDVMLPGGTLTVEWDGVGEVLLSGPVETVFTGEWTA